MPTSGGRLRNTNPATTRSTQSRKPPASVLVRSATGTAGGARRLCCSDRIGGNIRSRATMAEDEIRRLCEAGDARAATARAIQALGPELMGFLVVLAGNPDDAAEVFSDLCVRIWRGLPAFRWESSLRTWAYVLARRALHDH